MAIKGMLALVLVAVFAAIGAVVFSLDSMAASRDENDTPAAAAPAATHDHNVALPLASFVGEVPENADELAKAHKATDATLPPLQSGDLVRVHMTLKDMAVQIAPGRDLQHVGVRRPRRAGSGRARARGPNGRDDPDERRLDPALDRLPRCAHRAERRVQGRRPGRVVHVPLQGERPGRLHVPLRHEARPRAHRERDVRRDRRQPREGAAEGRPRVRARRERVVSERRTASTSRRASIWQRRGRLRPTGRRSTATRTSTSRIR